MKRLRRRRRRFPGPQPERFGTIALAHAHWSTLGWRDALEMAPGVGRRSLTMAPGLSRRRLEEVDYSEIGPGWALLAARLERRLRRAGVPPDDWPQLLAVGAGELHFVVPVRASWRAHRIAAAMERLALRCCEICLRSPAVRYSIDAPRDRAATLCLCAWHGARYAEIGLIAGLRAEAWNVVRYGAGPLRAMLLGGRLSPTGVEAAILHFVESVPAIPGEPGSVPWIPTDLMIHALSQLEATTLAGVGGDALLALLSDEDDVVREAAMLAMGRAHDVTAHASQVPASVASPAHAVNLVGAGASSMSPPSAPSAAAQPVAGSPAVGEPGAPEEPDATLPRPTYPLDAWLVDTASGSRYLLVRDAEQSWWLGGRNVASLQSLPLPPGRLYRIEAPDDWPPEVGRPLALVADRRLDCHDAARLPGGGKYTSPVVAVMPVLPAQEEELVQDELVQDELARDTHDAPEISAAEARPAGHMDGGGAQRGGESA